MLMKSLATGHLIEVESLADLTNPFSTTIVGRELWGEEIQDPDEFVKADLGFPSGEPLPEAWTDPHYLEPARPSPQAHPNVLPEAVAPGVPEAEHAGYHGA